jgi:protein required for attachment to host cells
MPIGKKRVGSKWVVYNKDTGKVYGKHPNSMRANAQIKAMASNGVDMSGEGKGEKETKKESTPKDKKIDEEQLKMGIKEEQEHKNTVHGDQQVIRQIAKDHLVEDSRYYTKLQKAGL